MLLYYYNDYRGNFGDDLNVYIWPKLLPGFFQGHRYTSGSEIPYRDTDSIFVGIGTLLKHSIPKRPQKFIFGAGCGNGEIPKVDDRWKIYCVRGPLTARALGISSNYVLSDPAILLRLLDLPPAPMKSGVAFIPHHLSARLAPWQEICTDLGITYINPTDDVAQVVRAIRASDVLVSEAMHGAVVANAFGVPWIPVKAYPHILAFKWQDWCASLGLTYQAIEISPIDWHRVGAKYSDSLTYIQKMSDLSIPHLAAEKLRRVVDTVKPTLSPEPVIGRVLSQLQVRLEKFKADFANI